ncbi:MAG: AsmA-like C-terminal region-containing protein [Flavobacteriaceae bacterium]|nr:AsmA-like C-terminal region-containing protein [Flavobacteriaceae bacterium]
MIDSLYINHQRKTVFLEEVSTSISIIDAFNEEIKITAISAKKGHINIFVDDDHYTNAYVFEANKKLHPEVFSLKITDNDIDVLIENIAFVFTEKIKNKRITAHLNKLDFTIDVANLKIPNVNLDVFMKEMGLNLEMGTFFNNARCVGSFQPLFIKDLHTIEVPNFNLKIDKQLFEVSANINTKTKNFIFLLEVDKVNFTKTNQLLAENIKSRLEAFVIIKPFKVNAKISGKFEYKNLTYVELHYETTDNEIVYKKDSLHLTNIDFKGKFINRFYNDSTKVENRKNYTFSFDSLSGNYLDIPFKLSDLSLKHNYSKPLQLVTKFEASGEMALLNDIINSKEYNLVNGTFQLDGNYNGKINSLSEILKSSEINLKINRLIIKSNDRLSRFNIPIVDLKITHNTAGINKLIVDFDEKNRLQINGNITNFSNLLTNNKIEFPTVATVNISSDYINFNSILKSFGSHKKSSESKNLTQVKKSFKTMSSKFNPKITFSFKKLNFFDAVFNNINIEGDFKNNKIDISSIRGNYKDGGAEAKLLIDLMPKKNRINEEVLKIDMSLKMNGKIEHWAEMLHSEKFFFQDANYTMEMNFNNEASNIAELMNHSNIVLNVDEGSMFYKPSNLTIPFNKISVSIKDKNAFLNDFELNLPNNQSLHLKGGITNFIEIFDESITDANITSSIIVFSNDINFSNFMDTFNPNTQKLKKKNNVKAILNDLYIKFKPSLQLDFERLSYNSVTLEKVNASLLFIDINTLNVKNAYCFFYNKKLTLDAEFDISNDTQTQFSTNFNLDNFAIENLLSSFNNFGYKQLGKPTEITGVINLNADFSGIINDAEGVIYDSLEADLTYDIEKLNLNNFQPIIDSGNKVFRKKRFEEIKFANINSTLNLKNNIILIPSTNVQSTAFDFFIEGKLDNTNHTDLWISIPLSNLKRRDLTQAPNKKTFDKAGRKIYLEITAGKDGGLEQKVHLRDKKQKRKTN